MATVRLDLLADGSDDDMVGRVLAERYRVLRVLGQGGMGRIYEAVQENVDRLVAIKVLRADRAPSLDHLHRFHLEARATSRLRHPNTVRIFDFGATDGGLPFLVMELLEGETLAARLEHVGALSEAEAADLATHVASALEEAHRAGVIHRDLKPENLFFSKVVGLGEVVKVCDFGIARMVAPDDESAGLTGSGMAMGTPLYMAPEQIAGRAAGAPADIYALGVVLYEALSGAPPFADLPRSALLNTRLHHESPPLSAQGPRGPISAEMRLLVRSMLALDPAQRPASAAKVAAALRGIDSAPDGAVAGASSATSISSPSVENGAAADLTRTSNLRLGAGAPSDTDARPSGLTNELAPRNERPPSETEIWVPVEGGPPATERPSAFSPLRDLETGSTALEPAAFPGSSTRRRWWMGAVVLMAGALVGWSVLYAPRTDTPPPTEAQVEARPEQPIAATQGVPARQDGSRDARPGIKPGADIGTAGVIVRDLGPNATVLAPNVGDLDPKGLGSGEDAAVAAKHPDPSSAASPENAPSKPETDRKLTKIRRPRKPKPRRVVPRPIVAERQPDPPAPEPEPVVVPPEAIKDYEIIRLEEDP